MEALVEDPERGQKSSTNQRQILVREEIDLSVLEALLNRARTSDSLRPFGVSFHLEFGLY